MKKNIFDSKGDEEKNECNSCTSNLYVPSLINNEMLLYKTTTQSDYM